MNKNITILSRHNDLEDAIAEAGGLNREYNSAAFQKEIDAVKKQAAVQEFYVVESNGRKIVLWQYECDIKLWNEFNPYGATLSSSTTVGWYNATYNCFSNVQTIANNRSNRKKIAEMQEGGSDLFVLNF